MIPLRLPAVIEAGTTEPFIAVVANEDGCPVHDLGSSGSAELFLRHAAPLERSADSTVTLKSHFGRVRLSGVSPADLLGDVLLIDPPGATAHRLIRARSPHNTLLVTERCDQLCVMCSQPPKKTHVDLFDHFVVACKLAPANMTIGISGGEPTLYKDQLFDLIEDVFEARPDVRFHVLTNGQHFARDDARRLGQRALREVLWGIPLYAAEPGRHDAIVKKAGAFERLLEGFVPLMLSGAAIELRTVVLKDNAELLPELARLVAAQLPFIRFWAIMQLENAGFARRAWPSLFFDTSLNFAPIAGAIDVALSRGIGVSLYNFPLCTVPDAYRSLCASSISDWKRRYLSACACCSLKNDCGGFFEWYPECAGFAGIRPVP